MEVEYTSEDNNNTRLGGSVNPEPTMGSYSTDYAKSTPPDTKDTGGVVGRPAIGESYGLPAMNSSVDMTNSDTNLNITNSEENLSAKFKYPTVSQDVPEKGRDQFNDHS